MPFVTAKSQRDAYDVIVVGSGAAGGQSAYTLCMDGAKVLMLEAGRRYSPETETPMFQTPDLAPLAAVVHRKSPLASTTQRWTGAGRYPESRMCAPAKRLRVASNGGAHACWAVARITGDESRCATVRTTSSRAVGTGSGSIGRWATMTSRRITTRSSC